MSSHLSRLKAHLHRRRDEDSKRLERNGDLAAGDNVASSAIPYRSLTWPIELTPHLKPADRPSHATSTRADESSPEQHGSIELESAVAVADHDDTETPSSELTPAERLWNKAYDAVKRSESKLIDTYEKILSQELNPKRTHYDLSQSPNEIEQTNEAKRCLQMKQLVQIRLAKLEKEENVKRVVGEGMRGVFSLKDAVGFALQPVPQAALAWAGVCFAIQILTNPTTESQANRDGTSHILTRMTWYDELSNLLSTGNTDYDKSLAGVQTQVEGRLVDLYTQVIAYLAKSVCACFRNRIYTTLRDTLQLDNWSGSLKGVEDAEVVVRQDYAILDIQDVRSKLEKLVDSARSLEKKLIYDKADQACLQDLRQADPRDEKMRIEQTKGGLLRDSYRWILDNSAFQRWREDPQSPMFWIKGDPGKGKTMLLCGIIDELKDPNFHSGLSSFFFCQATDSRINSATAVLRGLLFLLIDQQPALLRRVREKYDHAGRGLFEDASAWVVLCKIFRDILQDLESTDTYIVIDALDECVKDLNQLLDLIVQALSTPSRVKWILSSRNWPEIKERLDAAKQKETFCLELNPESVSAAVGTYIEAKVQKLSEQKSYDDDLREFVRGHLVSKANSTFLWVALVCDHLENVPKYNTRRSVQKFPPGLEPFYQAMFQRLCLLEEDESDLLKQILAVTMVVHQPITIGEMRSLIRLPVDILDDTESLSEMVGRCGSFLTIRDHAIYFVHQSAKDFLFQHCSYAIFPSGEGDVHYSVFYKSLEAMSQTLRRDIYGLCAPGYPIEQVLTPDPDPLADVRYACVYWARHLEKWDSYRSSSNDNENIEHISAINTFLRHNFLYWLEALSLLQACSEGPLSILLLKALLKGNSEKREAHNLAEDAHRFCLYHRWVIENYPLQAYATALIFSPTQSLTRQGFAYEEPKWVRSRTAVNETWSALLLTLQDKGDHVGCLSLSQDDQILAAACKNSVKFWNVTEAKCFSTIEIALDAPRLKRCCLSHDGKLFVGLVQWQITIWNVIDSRILARCGESQSYAGLTFLPTSERLVSLLHSGIFETWEVSTGEKLITTQSQLDDVERCEFSREGDYCATVPTVEDDKIKILETQTGQCLQILEHSPGKSWAQYAFSRDTKRFAASSDTCVTVWDVINSSCIATFDLIESLGVQSLALSNDGICLAFGLITPATMIQNMLTNQSVQIRQREIPLVYPTSILFSRNGDRLMLGTDDGSVEIWDISDFERLLISEPQPWLAPTFSFSSDPTCVLSVFPRGRLRITDKSNPGHEEMTETDTKRVRRFRFSHDNFFLATEEEDNSIIIRETKSLRYLRSCDTQNEEHGALLFSHNDIYLASISERNCFRLWKVATGECVQRFDSRSGKFTALAFSPGHARLASGTENGEMKIWDITTSESVKMLRSALVEVSSLQFSHDSSLLASVLSECVIQIWDASNGKGLQMFKCHRKGIRFITSLAFSFDNKRLASVWADGDVNIWDIASGGCNQTVWIAHDIMNMSFDPSGTRLRTKTGIFTLDPVISKSSPNKNERRIRRLQQLGYGLSPDLSWITHNSENLLWIPPEYRPDYAGGASVQSSRIAIIPNSGRAIVLQFVESEELIVQLGSASGRPTWRSPVESISVENDWIELKNIPRRIPSAEMAHFRSGTIMPDDKEEESEGSETTLDD